MRVSNQSWHYKVVKHFYTDFGVPDNLCHYMRVLALGCALIAVATAAVAALALGSVFCMVVAVLFTIDVYVHDLSWFPVVAFGNPEDQLVAWVILGYALITALSGFWIWFRTENWRYTTRQRYRNWRHRVTIDANGLAAVEEPTVFGQWLEDAHNRVCRRIEVVDALPTEPTDQDEGPN